MIIRIISYRVVYSGVGRVSISIMLEGEAAFRDYVSYGAAEGNVVLAMLATRNPHYKTDTNEFVASEHYGHTIV